VDIGHGHSSYRLKFTLYNKMVKLHENSNSTLKTERKSRQALFRHLNIYFYLIIIL